MTDLDRMRIRLGLVPADRCAPGECRRVWPRLFPSGPHPSANIEELVEAGHEQGVLSRDCTARGIAFLQVDLVGILDASPESPERYRRHLQFFRDGVRVSE
ncbi:hypothetical protein AAFP35_17840 [Gordonia sp. CPCC 206044]|uniref:hypothetical protein n=1 Tax=Gordonia sp. CPCC 206044 TaxID=3140793 RepID=UPI003AF37EB4